MPLPNNSPNNPCIRCLSYKACSFIVGILHLVSTISIFILTEDRNRSSGATTTFVLIGITTVVFCVLLLIGLIKNIKAFITAYLIFFAIYIALIVIVLFICLFTPSIHLGAGGFFSGVMCILVYVLYFSVVYIYYTSSQSL